MNKSIIATLVILVAIAAALFGYLAYVNYRATPQAANQSPHPASSDQLPLQATGTTSTSTQSQSPQPISNITIYCSNDNCAVRQINAGAGTLTRDCYRSLDDCQTAQATSQTACQTDPDCVPKECCHPTACINVNYKSACNLLCTQDCVGPLDCNAGSCKCVNNNCAAVSNTPGYPK